MTGPPGGQSAQTGEAPMTGPSPGKLIWGVGLLTGQYCGTGSSLGSVGLGVGTTVPALVGGGAEAVGVLAGAGEVHAVRTSNSPVSITMRESRLLVISLTRLRVRAFDPASLFGLMLPPLTKPRQDPGNNYVQDCLQKMSRPSTPALHRASRNRLRGAGLRSREKAPFYERLGTKPAAKVRCQLPPGQVASRE
jgi:hypothetical protein